MASYTASGGISQPFYFADAGWVSDTIDDRIAEPDLVRHYLDAFRCSVMAVSYKLCNISLNNVNLQTRISCTIKENLYFTEYISEEYSNRSLDSTKCV
jgi:hypothetical protein